MHLLINFCFFFFFLFFPLLLLILFFLAPDGNSFDHNFARIERVLRSHEDPDSLPKVIFFSLR